MITLSEILNDENRRYIIDMAKRFGFVNVRIVCDPQEFENELVFVVSYDPQNNDDAEVPLEAVLCDKFNCKAGILVENELKPLDMDILERCADLNDKNKIQELFQDELDNINFTPIDKNDRFHFYLSRARKLASDILQGSEKKNKVVFFKPKEAELDEKESKRKSIEGETENIREALTKHKKQRSEEKKASCSVSDNESVEALAHRSHQINKPS